MSFSKDKIPFRRRVALTAFLTLIGSCQIPSKVAMDGIGGRTAYNVTVQESNSEQMLLNLVRLRYSDIPFFLDVTSITTQSTFRSELSPTFPIPGFTQDNPATIGTGVMWQDQPTLTYTPLEGSAFAARMLRPIELQTIQLLTYSGWDVDRIFRMLIQNFEGILNAPETSDLPDKYSEYARFMEFTSLLRAFQRKGELQLGVNVKKAGGEGHPSEETLQIAFPMENNEGKQLAEIMRCREAIGGRCRREVDFGFNARGKIGVMTRSILSCMYYLSHGVQVPQEHIDSGMVKAPVCPDGVDSEEWQKMFCQLIHVCWSRFPPKDPYVAVKYQDYWYYIEECDRQSKKTFALLMQLYNLNAIVPTNRGPILTLPLR